MFNGEKLFAFTVSLPFRLFGSVTLYLKSYLSLCFTFPVGFKTVFEVALIENVELFVLRVKN
jgi:hypothetical protein